MPRCIFYNENAVNSTYSIMHYDMSEINYLYIDLITNSCINIIISCEGNKNYQKNCHWSECY
jgi:hypothetical protein